MSEDMKTEFEEARKNGANSNHVVSREKFVRYWTYLGYLSAKDQEAIKSGDTLRYMDINIQCA